MAVKAAFAGLYRRADSPFWWIWVRVLGTDGKPVLDSKGKAKRKPLSTGIPLENEKDAQALLEQVCRQQETKHILQVPTGPLTLGEYGGQWLARRRAAGLFSVGDDEGRWRKHVASHALARMPLVDVRMRHLREFVAELAGKPSTQGGNLSPRSVLNVYTMLHTLFADAVAEELIESTPATLSSRRRQLPAEKDKDPAWRATAVFTKAEVESLLSDERIPEYRRVAYAVLFLTGCRFGEFADRRMSHYDANVEPLGRLLVTTAWSQAVKKQKRTKTGAVPNIPVHPTLARVLAEWRLSGFYRMAGRHPGPSDFLVPSNLMARQKARNVLRWFHIDLATLGFRKRRIHDARRTFITLALADGASKDLLRWITHGPSRDQMSAYESPPWEALCREVGKLRITLKDGPATPLLRSAGDSENGNGSSELEAGKAECHRGCSPSHSAGFVQFREGPHVVSGVCNAAPPVSCSLVRVHRSNVAPESEGEA